MHTNLQPCFLNNTIEFKKLNFKNPIVEIGFGNGDFTIWLSQHFPDKSILAVDKWHPGIRALIHKCRNKRLNNLYVFNLDANLFVEYLLKPNQVERFYFNYPDPFFKKRDIKRRLLNTKFLKWVAFKLKPHGKVYIRTDIEDYYRYVLEQLESIKELFEIHTEFDEELPSTKCFFKWLKKKRKKLDGVLLIYLVQKTIL
jgi:tRNA (guanine-N7-)-methyltransferase